MGNEAIFSSIVQKFDKGLIPKGALESLPQYSKYQAVLRKLQGDACKSSIMDKLYTFFAIALMKELVCAHNADEPACVDYTRLMKDSEDGLTTNCKADEIKCTAEGESFCFPAACKDDLQAVDDADDEADGGAAKPECEGM